MKKLLVHIGVMALIWSSSAAAQQPATLDRVDELTRAGRIDEARGLLIRWWGGSHASAASPELQRGLWLRGRLTVDPEQAALDFRTLVAEYPGGPYTGPALLRLALADFARGDSAAAATRARHLVEEYPATAATQEAAELRALVGTLPDPEGLPDREAPPRPEPRPEVADTLIAEVVTAEPVTAEPVPTETVAGARSVQLGAFSSEERAWALYQRAVAAGLDARVVRVAGSDLIRVRIGLFSSLNEAEATSRRVQDLGFETAVVEDLDREERIVR